MKLRALVVGVESYLEGKVFEKVLYAKRDAEGMSKVLEGLGYEVVSLVDKFATAGRVRSGLRQIVSASEDGDGLMFYFVGHGAAFAGENYLLTHDAVPGDAAEAGVPLRQVFEMLGEARAARKAVYLDCSHTGMTAGAPPDVTAEVAKFLADSKDAVVFSACSAGECSYPNVKSKQGIWAEQLLKVLRGEVPELLADGVLSAKGLQDHLSLRVTESVGLNRDDGLAQTPMRWGGECDLLVAELTPVLEKKVAKKKPVEPGFKRAHLERVETGEVRRLAGFRKGNYIPDRVSSTADAFIAGVGAQDAKAELDEVYALIQRSRRFKNREIEYDEDSGIKTPKFRFSVMYGQNGEAPSEYVMTRVLDNVRDPAILDEEWFNQCFRNKFDSVVFTPNRTINVGELIDLADDSAELQVSTNPRKTECTLETQSFDGTIVVTADRIRFNFGNKLPPSEMMARLSVVRSELAGIEGVGSKMRT